MSGLLDVEAAAGLAVYGARSIPGAAEAMAALVREGVPGLLAAKDPTLWGPDAEPEAKIRLGWVDTFRRSRALLSELDHLYDRVHGSGLSHVALAGMGGSSLAPEVIAGTLGVGLTVLDTTDPHQVRAALADRLASTVVVVSSKSGGTVETHSHFRAYRQAFEDAGLTGIGQRFVFVTDPGSPLEGLAHEIGAAVVLADPEVGGRYSALTAFGLVPTALAGINVAELLDQAEAFAPSLAEPQDNPALALGAALGVAALAGRDKVALAEDGTGIVGLGDWAEQLIAESTGKNGRGILPIVIETPTAPVDRGPDVLMVTVGGSLLPGAVPGSGIVPDLAVNGPLGAQFLAWEYAVAIAGRLIGINPFDQPNVAESKENTKQILESGLPDEEPSYVDGAVEAYGPLGGPVPAAVTGLLKHIGPDGYLAVMAYLDRFGAAQIAEIRAALAKLSGRPVTFGWGPRFLHSTGQYHKGGPQNGVFLQITGEASQDLDVPGAGYTFGTLQAAQAAGDRQALASRGRQVLHLHLTDRAAGVPQILAAVGGLKT
jgi:glucose-6-phosphate isomerase